MNRCSFLLPVPLTMALVLSVAEAKDNAAKWAKKSEKEQAKQRKRSDKELARQRKQSETDWRQRTEGHRPQDLDGNGIITRNEWPGNDTSFRQLDWDGDGVLSDRDRRRSRDAGRSPVYDRNGRWIR